MSYRSLRALDVKSQAVIGKPPCRSVSQCQSKPFHQPTALYDTKEKTRKNRWLRLLVMGYRFLVNNALLMEDFSRRKGNPTKNLQPITNNHLQRFFLVFFFWCLCSCRCLWAGSRSVTETYENASAYRYGRCEAASIRKTSKDVFMVFFYLRENYYCAMVVGCRFLVNNAKNHYPSISEYSGISSRQSQKPVSSLRFMQIWRKPLLIII